MADQAANGCEISIFDGDLSPVDTKTLLQPDPPSDAQK